MKEFFRYIEPEGKHYKYVTANNREQALDMLSFLIDKDGYGSIEETYFWLQEFEKIEYYEVPDNVNILYESEKNQLCVSGTSEGSLYLSGTNIGWTQNWYQLMLHLFYVLPYKIFVVANSREAAYSKIFPLESAIKRIEKAKDDERQKFMIRKKIRKIEGMRVEIFPFMESKNFNKDFKALLPEGVTILNEPTLDYDRWSNYITGYLFRRKGHQEKITEQQFYDAIKNGLLSTYDLLFNEIPVGDTLCNYQLKNRIIFEVLYPSYNICQTRSLAYFLKLMESDMDFFHEDNGIIGVLTSTGEIIEVEDETAKEIKNNIFRTSSEYEVFDMKKNFKYVRVIKKKDSPDDLPF